MVRLLLISSSRNGGTTVLCDRQRLFGVWGCPWIASLLLRCWWRTIVVESKTRGVSAAALSSEVPKVQRRGWSPPTAGSGTVSSAPMLFHACAHTGCQLCLSNSSRLLAFSPPASVCVCVCMCVCVRACVCTRVYALVQWVSWRSQDKAHAACWGPKLIHLKSVLPFQQAPGFQCG